MLPKFDVGAAAEAIRARRAGMTLDPSGNEYLGYTGILTVNGAGAAAVAIGGLFVSLRSRRAQGRSAPPGARAVPVLGRMGHRAGARHVARLPLPAYAPNGEARERRRAARRGQPRRREADLKGNDELGRLGRAFDAMALEVAQTQTRLRNDIAERKRASEALRVSEESYRAIFDSAEDAILVRDVDTGAIVDVNPAACRAFGYTRDEFRGSSTWVR